ncbi:MAG: metal ABC transporter permease [Candidatus Staskawiczbacteria bacterium]|nr:metal ABC transporter permease [Candidatus Staskawiczbacteria bacterium]
MFLDIFQYSFIVRGLEAGIIVAIIAPLIGVFLVLRRYSLIADTLAHVSLAGISIGLILGINPVLTALGTTVIASLGIEKLRTSKRVYGESALALFLSGSLALAIVLLSLARGFNANLFSYLFGSITTVAVSDVYIIFTLAIVVIIVLAVFYKELVYITFDESSAKVSGIPTKLINTILIFLSAITVSLSIPIVGVLLISALIVIPVISALQLRKSFIKTILYSEIISIFSVITGIFLSFYLNLSAGGAIVLIMLAIFIFIFTIKNHNLKY